MPNPTTEQVKEQVAQLNEVLALMDAGVIPAVNFFGESNRNKARIEQAALQAFLNGTVRDNLDRVVTNTLKLTEDDPGFDDARYLAEDVWDWANGDYIDPDGEDVTPAAGWMALRRDKPAQSNG